MHKKRVVAVADLMERIWAQERASGVALYSQLYWGRLLEEQPNGALACGTPGCVGGWALHLAGSRVRRWSMMRQAASRWLDLTFDEGDKLFDCFPLGPHRRVTARRAAKVLRHFADTGKINWRIRVTPRQDGRSSERP